MNVIADNRFPRFVHAAAYDEINVPYRRSAAYVTEQSVIAERCRKGVSVTFENSAESVFTAERDLRFVGKIA